MKGLAYHYHRDDRQANTRPTSARGFRDGFFLGDCWIQLSYANLSFPLGYLGYSLRFESKDLKKVIGDLVKGSAFCAFGYTFYQDPARQNLRAFLSLKAAINRCQLMNVCQRGGKKGDGGGAA